MTPVSSATHLTVHIVGAAGESDRTLMLERAPGGAVRVREWSESNWAGPAEERVLPAEEVYAEVERAHHERRRVTVSLPELREWLGGPT